MLHEFASTHFANGFKSSVCCRLSIVSFISEPLNDVLTVRDGRSSDASAVLRKACNWTENLNLRTLMLAARAVQRLWQPLEQRPTDIALHNTMRAFELADEFGRAVLRIHHSVLR